ncbi:MAG: DUF5667 domain-containing protein [bacterium]|nr:DUF5667 domain-containing protein [bacterium]
MRYAYFFFIGFLFIASSAYAQFALLPPAGMTAKNPLYIFERAFESIGTLFTFGRESKIERLIMLAEERLSEAVVLSYEKHPKTNETIVRFGAHMEKAAEQVDRSNNPELASTVLRSLAKHFAVFEEILDGVSEQMRVGIESAFEEDRNLQKRLLFEVAGDRPLHASELGFLSLRERLAKLKIEVDRGRQYETSIITSHIKDIFDVVASAVLREEAPSTEFLFLLSNDITRTLESFDEIERSPKYPSGETGETISALKAGFIDLQISVSRGMIPVDPQFVVRIIQEGAQSRVSAFDRASGAKETVLILLLREYETYALFAEEVSNRTGRFMLDREEGITVADELERLQEKYRAQISAKRDLFSTQVRSEMDRIFSQ